MRYLVALILLFHNHIFADNFLELCRYSINPEIRKTIAAIKTEIIDDGEDESCEGLAERLKQRETLNLNGYELTDLSPLEQLTNLKVLYLSDNALKNIWPLATLANLLVLNLENNQISDIGVLPDLTQLEVVILNKNKVTNLYPIKDLLKLKMLKIDDNPIFEGKTDAEVQEIMGLIESLILYRSYYTINDYAPLDLNNIEEAAVLLNDMAQRGDLSYFRVLQKSPDKAHIFDNQELWSRLDFATKKIMTAIALAPGLANFFQNQLIEHAKTRLNLRDFSKGDDRTQEIFLNISEQIEQQKPGIERALQYFMMEPVARCPMSFNDTKALENYLSSCVKKMGPFANQEILAATFPIYFSPYFITRALQSFGSTSVSHAHLSFENCREQL